MCSSYIFEQKEENGSIIISNLFYFQGKATGGQRTVPEMTDCAIGERDPKDKLLVEHLESECLGYHLKNHEQLRTSNGIYQYKNGNPILLL